MDNLEKVRRLHVLLNLIRGLYKALDNDWRKAAGEVGLTPCQQHLLWIVHFRNGSTLTELSELGIWHVSTVMSLVERMEKNGLVIKEVDPNDARTKRIYATEKGERIRESSMKGEANFRLLGILDQMDPKEIEDGTKILYHLVNELLGEKFIEYVTSTSTDLVSSSCETIAK